MYSTHLSKAQDIARVHQCQYYQQYLRWKMYKHRIRILKSHCVKVMENKDAII